MSLILFAESRMHRPISSLCTLQDGRIVSGDKFPVNIPSDYFVEFWEKPVMVVRIKPYLLKFSPNWLKKKVKLIIAAAASKSEGFEYILLVAPKESPAFLHEVVSGLCAEYQCAFVDSSLEESRECVLSIPKPKTKETDLLSMFHLGLYNRVAIAKV